MSRARPGAPGTETAPDGGWARLAADAGGAERAAGAGGIGIDLIEINRVEGALERHPALAERLFQPGELAYARVRARPARHLAARFAAKEAAVKALGAGSIPFREIEVVSGEPPTLRLHGRAEAAASEQGISLSVSLTHSRELASAVVRADPL